MLRFDTYLPFNSVFISCSYTYFFKLMTGPVQQMQQMWNYPQQQQQQKQQQQQQNQQQQPLDNKYEPQQSIVNRFGKPNPKEQEAEYDTMKEVRFLKCLSWQFYLASHSEVSLGMLSLSKN